jgi:hypothetical protein
MKSYIYNIRQEELAFVMMDGAIFFGAVYYWSQDYGNKINPEQDIFKICGAYVLASVFNYFFFLRF